MRFILQTEELGCWYRKFKDCPEECYDIYTAAYDTQDWMQFKSPFSEEWPSIVEFYNTLCAMIRKENEDEEV